jgi:predicted oxidoreductase
MKKVHLSENGPLVSPVIYSFWRAMQDPDGVSYVTIKSKLKICLELGINTFDHADIYGNYQVEKLFGAALKEAGVRREDLVISTKCGINIVDAARPAYRTRHYDNSPGHITQSVEQSLIHLQTDYIDILLLHHYDHLLNADETASALTRLVKSGKVRHIGVANFTVHQHRLLQSRLGLPIITNHLEFNLLKPAPLTDGTIDYLKEHYSKPLAWAPLAGGRLLDKNDEATFNIRSTLQRIAGNRGVSEEQVAIAWLLKAGALPVLGTNRISSIRSAVAAVNITLDQQDWYDLYFSAIHSPGIL